MTRSQTGIQVIITIFLYSENFFVSSRLEFGRSGLLSGLVI